MLRTKSSPVASGPVPSTTLPSSSNRRISTLGAALAARARLAQLVLGPQHRVHAELGRAVDLEERVLREVGEVLLLQREGPRRRVRDHARIDERS